MHSICIKSTLWLPQRRWFVYQNKIFKLSDLFRPRNFSQMKNKITRWVALMIQLEQQQHGELGLDQKLINNK